MAIKALIFDFDGLILDTEGPEYEAWRTVYKDHGCELDFDQWVQRIGRASHPFDPYDALEAQYGPIEREAVRAAKRARFGELMARETLLPGVREYIEGAKRIGLKVAVASSAPRDWIFGHVEQFGIHCHFDVVKCRGDVTNCKPDPELYLAAVQALGVKPAEAIALEDSPNGILAAKGAGIFCVAVPNGMTSRLDLSHADLLLNSLADLSLEELVGKAAKELEKHEAPARRRS